MQRTLLPDLCLNDLIYSFSRTGYLAYILTAYLMLTVPTDQTKTSGSLKKWIKIQKLLHHSDKCTRLNF